jgi:hypothetical protein
MMVSTMRSDNDSTMQLQMERQHNSNGLNRRDRPHILPYRLVLYRLPKYGRSQTMCE